MCLSGGWGRGRTPRCNSEKFIYKKIVRTWTSLLLHEFQVDFFIHPRQVYDFSLPVCRLPLPLGLGPNPPRPEKVIVDMHRALSVSYTLLTYTPT